MWLVGCTTKGVEAIPRLLSSVLGILTEVLSTCLLILVFVISFSYSPTFFLGYAQDGLIINTRVGHIIQAVTRDRALHHVLCSVNDMHQAGTPVFSTIIILVPVEPDLDHPVKPDAPLSSWRDIRSGSTHCRGSLIRPQHRSLHTALSYRNDPLPKSHPTTPPSTRFTAVPSVSIPLGNLNQTNFTSTYISFAQHTTSSPATTRHLRQTL